MTTARSPLVRLSTGKIAELPGGDSILGAPGGPAATVAVGTTTTGAPGSSATVTNVGSSSAAVLDFTIPQGTAGTDGTNGTNGANGTGSGANFICNGRLTLTSGVPVTTADVTGATTIYFTPFRGNQVSTYDSSVWTGHTFSEISLALGTLTSGANYDLFVYSNSGTMTLELSAAWTNNTTRADALAVQDGVYVKSADHSRRYLGTFRTTSTTTTEDSGGGTTTQVGGKRFLWNYYNRVARALSVVDRANTWSYNVGTYRQANGAAGNKVEFVTGLAEDSTSAQVMHIVAIGGNSARGAHTSVGVDSTSSPSLIVGDVYNATSAEVWCFTAVYSGVLGVGYHYLAWLEYGSDGSCVFHGSNDGAQSGLLATVTG